MSRRFNPTSVGAQAAWWKLDRGVTLGGAFVASLADLTGNGNTEANTAGSRPGYIASGLGGFPYMTGGAGLSLVNTTQNIVASGAARTVWWVGYLTSGTAGGTAIIFKTAGNRFDCRYQYAGVNTYFASDDVINNWTSADGHPKIDGKIHLFELKYAVGSPLVYLIDGSTVAITVNPNCVSDNGTTGSSMMLGAFGAPWSGGITEMGVYPGLLTAQQDLILAGYAEGAYKVSP